ncbi:flagellar basal body rod protein FlgC [bacterium]|nr:flagellar basal body rod protein FlgC [bacterium]
MVDLINSLHISSSGMKAQSERMKIISQNIANADDTASTPGGKPYQRKVISFRNALDKELGTETVRVHKVGVDKSEFEKKYDPSHPAADAQGYVLYPNVNVMVEMGDMKEAERTYDANVQAVEVAKSMMQNTLGVLR